MIRFVLCHYLFSLSFNSIQMEFISPKVSGTVLPKHHSTVYDDSNISIGNFMLQHSTTVSNKWCDLTEWCCLPQLSDMQEQLRSSSDKTLFHRAHHVAQTCFSSSLGWSYQTLPLSRAFHISHGFQLPLQVCSLQTAMLINEDTNGYSHKLIICYL